MQNLQFYLSKEIVLYHASNDGQASTGNGGLTVHSDRQRREVILRKGTPGIAKFVRDDYVVVSFEKG
ncbi:MAG: hypothetical protein HKN32_01795, partial [Flavobacteriales bacterium]|nr:hypothetical protein [Flavobacteriales bacterium]